MVWSMRVSRLATPIARSISSRAAVSGPMCLLLKVPGVGKLITLLRQFCVGSGIEQSVEVAGARHLHRNHPRVVRIGVDGFRTLGKGRVYFDHLSRDRRIQLGNRLDRFDRSENVTVAERAPHFG